jgi:membrane protease subunit HflC
MKQNVLSLTIGALLLFIVCLLLFVFQVRTSEVVVVTRFGRPDRSITDPGPHWRLPWPIEKPHRFDQRTQNFEDKLTEGLTQDSFNLLTSVYVGWKITDPSAFFPKFAGTDQPIAEAERVLERMLSNAKAAVIGKHPLVDFLSTDPQANRFADIESEILALVQSQVKVNNYGLEVRFLGLKRLGLPESVTQSVFERMTKEREVLTRKSEADGEADAAKIRSGANRNAAERLSAAKAEATQIIAQGEAEAAKSLEVFQQNPELASFLFRLTALENSLKERSILIFDQHTTPFDLFQGPSTNLLNPRK